jgi:hypothetical protein
MNTISLGRYITIVISIISLSVAQTSCSIAPKLIPENNEQSDPQQSENLEEPEAGAGSPIEPAAGSEYLPCPAKGAAMLLGFDHALTMNYVSTSMTHFLHQGWLHLTVTDHNGAIVSDGSPSLTYSLEGRMSDECSLSGEGSMKPTAHGSCEAGVVSLFIKENWMAIDGEMVCVDSDGE